MQGTEALDSPECACKKNFFEMSRTLTQHRREGLVCHHRRSRSIVASLHLCILPMLSCSRQGCLDHVLHFLCHNSISSPECSKSPAVARSTVTKVRHARGSTDRGNTFQYIGKTKMSPHHIIFLLFSCVPPGQLFPFRLIFLSRKHASFFSRRCLLSSAQDSDVQLNTIPCFRHASLTSHQRHAMWHCKSSFQLFHDHFLCSMAGDPQTACRSKAATGFRHGRDRGWFELESINKLRCRSRVHHHCRTLFHPSNTKQDCAKQFITTAHLFGENAPFHLFSRLSWTFDILISSLLVSQVVECDRLFASFSLASLSMLFHPWRAEWTNSVSSLFLCILDCHDVLSDSLVSTHLKSSHTILQTGPPSRCLQCPSGVEPTWKLSLALYGRCEPFLSPARAVQSQRMARSS